MTVVVWVLLLVWGPGSNGNNHAVVDNIASRANCEALARGFTSDDHVCMPVRKVRG